MGDLADGRSDAVVDDDQVVVGVERQLVGIKRPFFTPGSARELIGEQATRREQGRPEAPRKTRRLGMRSCVGMGKSAFRKGEWVGSPAERPEEMHFGRRPEPPPVLSVNQPLLPHLNANRSPSKSSNASQGHPETDHCKDSAIRLQASVISLAQPSGGWSTWRDLQALSPVIRAPLIAVAVDKRCLRSNSAW